MVNARRREERSFRSHGATDGERLKNDSIFTPRPEFMPESLTWGTGHTKQTMSFCFIIDLILSG